MGQEGPCIIHDSSFFLSSALVLSFGVVGVSVYVLYIVHARGWDGEGETGKLLRKSYSYSRVEYSQKTRSVSMAQMSKIV